MDKPLPTAGALHPLEAATALTWHGDHWVGHTNKEYWAFLGPYGGATAAVLLRAALDHPDRIGDPLALTVNYCAPVAEGPFDVAVCASRTNKSTQHWSIELTQNGGEAIATATAVFAKRRPGFTYAPVAMPQAPKPADVPTFNLSPSPSWVDRYEMKFISGLPKLGRTPHAEPQSPETMLWLRDAEPRPLDVLSLASMSDAFIGRIFQVLGVFVPFGTVTLTTYFHCAADETAVPDGWVLGHADAAIFRGGFADQTVRLWAPDGRLLASGIQATYFRDWAPEGKK